MRKPIVLTGWLLAAVSVASSVAAQEPLSLQEAIGRATSTNPAITARQAARNEAAQRLAGARAGWLPRVELTETWQRGNQPVFAFSSLLMQRRFSEADFAIASLNRPDPLNNFRAGVTVEQLLIDAGRTRAIVSSAAVGVELSTAALAGAEVDLAYATTAAYGQVLEAAANVRAADGGIAAALEDEQRAIRRRDVGLATEADVLSVRVHLAAVRERSIRSRQAERIARLELNRLITAPLNAQFTLELPPDVGVTEGDRDQLESAAIRDRADTRQVNLQHSLASIAERGARAAFFPQLTATAGYELNGGSLGERVSGWIVGAGLRWNLFAGGADVARLRELRHARERIAAERADAEQAARVQVQQALAGVDAARARDVVAREVVAAARESQRILRDRYDAGLAPINDVLRAAEAVLDAEAQQVSASVATMVARAALARAVGAKP